MPGPVRADSSGRYPAPALGVAAIERVLNHVRPSLPGGIGILAALVLSTVALVVASHRSNTTVTVAAPQLPDDPQKWGVRTISCAR
jgi:hypothetical protein